MLHFMFLFLIQIFIKLSVDPPVIRHAFPEETLRPGPAVFLKCVAGGNPTPEISWDLDGKKISNNERYQVGQYVTVNGDVVSYLNITSIHTNDGGLYKCFASSKVGTAEHSAKINVYGLPYIRQMEKKAIVAGETLVVTCPVAGYPIKSIVWERGNFSFGLFYCYNNENIRIAYSVDAENNDLTLVVLIQHC